jgi:coatomer subunit alpha
MPNRCERSKKLIAGHAVTTTAQGPKTLAYNPAESAVLITSDVDGGSYELYMVPKESARGDTAPVREGSRARQRARQRLSRSSTSTSWTPQA